MGRWVRVAAVAQCPPGAVGEWVVEERIVAWFNVEGEIYALDGICPHQGGPLGRGRLAGTVVSCPWHGWQFDVRTGCHQVSAALCHPRYPVKVEGNDILIQLGNTPSECEG